MIYKPPIDRAQEIKRINNLNSWPRWPFLPMKRATNDRGQWNEFGFLWADDPPKGIVYLASIYGIKGMDITNHPKKEYPTLEAMLDDGWIID